MTRRRRGSEQINIIIIIILAGRSPTSTHIGRAVLASLGELVHAGSEGLDVVVPSEGVRSVGLGGSGEGLVHSGVGLAGDKPLNVTVISEELIKSLDSSSGLEVSEHFVRCQKRVVCAA